MTMLNRSRPGLFLLAGLGLLMFCVALSGRSLGGEPGRQRDADEPFEYVSPEVERLEMFYGLWKVTERHFDAKGKVIAEVKGTEDIDWALNRRAIRRDYATATEVMEYQALGLLTWNAVEKKYHGVWFDNSSTAGPTTVKGDWNKKTRTMTFSVQALGPSGETIGYRVVEHFPDAQHRVATTYLIEGGESVKRMEVEYERTRKCPSRVFRIFDDGL
jgi:hypothetical protein